MEDIKPTTASQENKGEVPEGKLRSGLIFGTLGVGAAIIFGLLYLFVIAPAAPTEGAGWSVGWFLFSFATGLTMIVLPCTLPLAFVIVPLSMGKGLLKGLSMALAFGLGITVTLSIYGVLAAVVGSFAIDTLGAPLEVVKNWVYFVAGIFALLFALSEIGLLNVHMPTYSGAAPAFIQKRQEIFKAFLLGLFLGNVGVGCPHPATPLLLIEIASSGDILYGWLMFLVHAIGRVLPLILLAFMAILGVNGLNWLLTRKDAVEKATGWMMVFVAGFILTLGLFTHDWWVNSGIHSGLESITQESFFNELLNKNLDQAVIHAHGLEDGSGLFGLPLSLGNWALVALWVVPMWLWHRKRKKDITTAGSDPTEMRVLSVKRNFLIVIAIFLALMFIYFLPTNFFLKSQGGADHHAPTTQSIDGIHAMTDGTVMNALGEVVTGAMVMPDGSIMLADGTPVGTGTMKMAPEGEKFTKSTADLKDATGPELVELQDGDSYDITAAYVKKEIGNRTLRMLSYNGSVPGPFIKAPQGSEITLNFKNDTDIDQTIHSHGIRIDNNSDGVPYITQDPVKPGESYTYTVRFDDAGIFWYHPHTREDYGQELGLYGNYIVEPSDPDYWSPVNREVPLILDDILLDDDGIADFYKDFTNYALIGRFGNKFLVNGEQDYTTSVQAGEVIRFFITDVSNVQTYNLSIPGAIMKLVGADLSKFERETYQSSLLISPAERLVVEVYFPKAGTYKLMHTDPSGETELARFVAPQGSDVATSYLDTFNVQRTNTEVIDEMSALRGYRSAQPDKELLLTIDLAAQQVDHSAHQHDPADPNAPVDRLSKIQWSDPNQSDIVNTTDTILWQLKDVQTGKVNMDIDWKFKQGDLVKIRLVNDASADHVMQHPIHLHGQRFVILEENGVPNENLAWKDTVLVFPGETVDILVEMSNLGEWMSHCHIAEHLHAGMMLGFRVEDESGYATGDEYRATIPVNLQHGNKAQPDASVGSVEQQALVNSNTERFTFNMPVPQNQLSVSSEPTRFQANTQQQITITVFDSQGNSVQPSSDVDRPVAITFVKSDDSTKVYTYPGNTAFPAINDPAPSQNTPDTPGFDESLPHSHSFLGINTAYAHGGVDDGDGGAGRVFSYTIPVVFPSKGLYRGFVEFVPLGSTESVLMSFDVEVGKGSSNSKWVLFIIILAVPIVWFVRRRFKASMV